MGARGPQRHPTEDLKKRGSTRAIGRTIAKRDNEMPEPSDSLQGEARAIWFQMVADLKIRGHLSKSYSMSLELFCQTMHEFRELSRCINENGFVQFKYRTDRDTGEEIITEIAPYDTLKARREAASTLIRLGTQYGWTPASNQSLSDASKARDDDREEKFFGKVG